MKTAALALLCSVCMFTARLIEATDRRASGLYFAAVAEQNRIMRIGLAAIGDIQSVAGTIQRIEGWFPGSLSYRLNNPGNLTYAGQPGATPVQVCNPTCHTFAQFPDYQSGYQALLNQINLDASRGLSIASFTSKYAPAQDSNDPASYAAAIAAAEGLSVSDPLAAALADASSPPGLVSDQPADTGGTDTTLASVGNLFGNIDSATLAAGGVLAALALVLFMRD